MSTSGHDEILKEIDQTVLKLQGIAKDQQSFTLEIELSLIQSRIELIKGNIIEANQILEVAEATSKKLNIANHLKKVNDQKRLIDNEISKWEKLTQQKMLL